MAQQDSDKAEETPTVCEATHRTAGGVPQGQRAMLLAAAAIMLTVIYFAAVFLTPIILSALIAFVLDPFCDWIENRGLPRTIAALIVVVSFVFFTLAAASTLLPFLIQEAIAFFSSVPDLLQTLVDKLAEIAQSAEHQMGVAILQNLQVPRASTDQIIGWATSLLGNVVSGGLSLGRALAQIGIMVVVIFFLLRDFAKIVDSVDSCLPPRYRATIRELAKESYDSIAGFVRGQGLVCILLGAFYAVGLSIIGLRFGALVGLSAGLISFMPYIGSTTGFIVATGLAVAQFGSLLHILLVPGLFLLGHAIEGNILIPLLVGNRIRLHPIWVITALYAGGVTFGIIGLLLAVPLAAVVAVLVRFAIRQYKASSLFT